MDDSHESHAERMFRLLGNPVAEARVIYRANRSPLVGYFHDSREFADVVVGLSRDPEVAGVYMTVNRLKNDFRERATGLLGPGPATRAHHVDRIRVLPFDIDAVRDHPKGGRVCATDEEHAHTLALAAKMRQTLMADGWAEPLMVDSGNGAYLLFRVDLPNTEESRQMVARVLRATARQFDNEHAHIDTGVHDPSRVLRIAGTLNAKSVGTVDRPNRFAKIISTPDQLKVVTDAQLNAVADAYVEPVSEATTRLVEGPTLDDLSEQDRVAHNTRVSYVKEWSELNEWPIAQIVHGPCFTRIDYAYCPFKGQEHSDGRSAVLIQYGGRYGFKCFHSKCEGKGWAALQKAARVPFADFLKEKATQETTGQTRRQYNDPLLLAHRHAKKWSADSLTTTAHFHGELHRWCTKEGWVTTDRQDLNPWVRQTIQATFDEHASYMSRFLGDSVKPDPIRGTIINDTYQALESLSARQVPAAAQAPFWLEQHEWAAHDTLVLQNGILNVHRYIQGQDNFFVPPTPMLYYTGVAPFEFAEHPPAPACWHDFLASLWPDAQCRDLLQEIMGYCLWPAYDLQKFFLVIGPPRSGKGTIAAVLEALSGSACGLSLDDFASDFGLEQAVGKRLAIVPEVEKGPQKRSPAAVIAQIKAITGGDLVTVNRKHVKNISMRLPLKIVMQANQPATLIDNSGALSARLILLKMTESFVGREDKKLAAKLKAEYPGILLWALGGLRRLYHSNGVFTMPVLSKDEMEQAFATSAPVKSFISDTCQLNESRGIHTVALYEVFTQWWKDEFPSTEPIKDNCFAHELRAAAPQILKVRLKSASEQVHRCKDGRKWNIDKTPYDQTSGRPRVWLGVTLK